MLEYYMCAVNACADDHPPPDLFVGGGHGGHEAVHRALSRLERAANHKMDRTAMGHFYGVGGVTVCNRRKHRHIGLRAPAAVAVVKRFRQTVFIEADVLQTVRKGCTFVHSMCTGQSKPDLLRVKVLKKYGYHKNDNKPERRMLTRDK